MERLGLFEEPVMLPITTIPKQEGIPPLLYEEGWNGAEGKRSRRGLQTSCAEGDPFTVTSSVFPSLEGCVLYSGFVAADGNLVYNSSSAAIISVSSSTTTTDGSAETFWGVYEILDDGSFDFHCVSNETSTTLSYPVEATWICDLDGDGQADFPTSSQFSTSCGCSTTTVSTTDIGTETTTTTDIGTETTTTTDIGTETTTTTDIGTETTTTSCAEGDPFTIISSVFPSLEGCVLYSGFVTADGNLVYNSSSAAIFSVSSSTTTTDGSAETFWGVLEILDDGSFDFHCVSNETSTALPFPVEATWICDVDGDGELEFPTSSQFSTSCGCSTTTVSTTDIGTETTTTTEIGTETTTTTDISTETTTTSCAEGDPFTISSSVFPSLEGCVLYSGFVAADGNLVYNSSSAAIISVSSSTTTTDGSAETFWGVYEILDDGSFDFHCVSNETSTTLSNPVEATWICDLDGDGQADFPTSSQFSTSCGCLTTTVSTTDIGTETTTTTDIGTETTTTTDIGTETTTTTDIGTETTTTSCAEGDPFTIISSVFPSLEGCVLYSGFVTADGNLVYNSSSAAIFSVSSSTTTTDGSAETFWGVLEILDDGSFDFHCVSNETSTALPFPVEATWICDVDGDGELEFPTSSQFSTSCGCSTTTISTTDIGTETTTTTDIGTETTTTTDIGTETTTTTDIGTETTTTTDIGTETTTTTDIGTETTTTTNIGTETTTTTDTGTETTSTPETTNSATCNEGESLTITSTVFPEVVGCYSGTGTLNENEVVYTETRTTDDGQNGVVARNIGEDSAPDIRWIVGYSSLDTTSREAEVYCVSTDLAADVHPADVTSWICNLSGDGSQISDFVLVSDTDFAVTCGCTMGMTSSPSTTPGSEQNANVGHLSTTLSTFVAVGVGFTATVVHLVRL